ncbi:MAG: ATP-binding protein [Moraxellaceae bacterium]|nr:ATP-binding protein [Moraxellaceae bacterium]
MLGDAQVVPVFRSLNSGGMMQSVADVRSLAQQVMPFSPDAPLEVVAERFLGAELSPYLSVPVVDADGYVLGIISRYQLNEIYLKKFGRDLFGKRAVADFMKTDCLRVDVGHSVAEAAQYIGAHMRLPLSEDFIICDEGRYVGLGAVLSLLGAMEQQAAQSAIELRTAYQRLQSSQAQLVQSEKMASLGQMVAGVAHEINTPLGYVKNNVEIMREFGGQARQIVEGATGLADALLDPDGSDLAVAEKLAAFDELRQMLAPELLFDDMDSLFNDTLFGLDQIAELVMGLKNFSRLDQAMTDSVSLNDCVNNALLIARNTLKNKVDVIRQLGELPAIRCAPSQLNQVFLNLFTNAAQAMDGPGRLLIKTWADSGKVCFSVQDNGRGMTPEVLKRIFDPFFTTKPVGEGTGLGLAICWQIIEQHGGRIRVASEVGRGTRFLIELPCTQAAPAPAMATLAVTND